jgi:hypothetical protein
MNNIFLSQLNIAKGDDKKIVMPKTDEAPVSATEKLVREDIKKLTQNAEEIRKLKDQVEKKKKEGGSE